MKRINLCIVVLVALSLSNVATARMVTLVVHSGSQTAEIEVGVNEIAELRGHSGASLGSASNPFDLTIEKQGVTIPLFMTAFNNGYSVLPPEHVVTGPARIRLRYLGSVSAYCTWQIEPESFPPDKTIIIPQDTGARIALECSTNLTQWTEVYSATYTNSPSNKFFRIKAERLP